MILVETDLEQEVLGWVYSYDDNNKVLILSNFFCIFYFNIIEIVDPIKFKNEKEEEYVSVGVYHVSSLKIKEIV